MTQQTFTTTYLNRTIRTLCYATLSVLLALCAYFYTHGLNGPLMLDDFKIILPLMNISQPLENLEFIYANDFLFGRSIALLSFVLDINLNPDHPIYQLKLTNLCIHLAIGIGLFHLVSGLVKYTGLKEYAWFVATAVSGLWLLHPMNTSTVLYTVQRMAQLSCLFSVLCLLCYCYGRNAMEAHSTRWFQGHTAKSLSLLAISGFILFPLALLSKENALLIPVFIFGLEWFVLGHHHRPFSQLVRRSGILYLISIIIALVYLSYTGPSSLTDLSPFERLLTQNRVVGDYLFDLIVPLGTQSGLFFDNYAPSNSLINPLTTLACLLMHAFLLIVMVYWRQHPQLKLASLGVFLFYSGHLLESTILPLELYFEHRNYFASMGLLLSLVSLMLYTWQTNRYGKLASSILLGLFVLLNVTALERKITIWSDPVTMVSTAYANQPLSIRAKVQYAQLMSDNQRPEPALVALDQALNTPYHKKHAALLLQMLFIHCRYGIITNDMVYQQLASRLNIGQLIELSSAINNVLTLYQQQSCPESIDIDRLAMILNEFIQRTDPLNVEALWSLNYYLSFIEAEIKQDFDAARLRLLDQLKQGEIRAGYYLLDLNSRFQGDQTLRDTIQDTLQSSSRIALEEKTELINRLNDNFNP